MNAGKAFRTPDRASLETEESQVAFRCEKTSLDLIGFQDEHECRSRQGGGEEGQAGPLSTGVHKQRHFFSFLEKEKANLHQLVKKKAAEANKGPTQTAVL